MGFECPEASDNLDNPHLGRLESRFLSNRDHATEAMEYINQFDNSVFKSLTLLRCMRALRESGGLIVGVYRHPVAWKKAHLKKIKERMGRKVQKHYIWWYDYHAYMLLFHKEFDFPLIDFSMDFEHDMHRHFGDCISHYDPSMINETEYRNAQEPLMSLYGELTECRKSMAPITLTPNMLPMRNAGTN